MSSHLNLSAMAGHLSKQLKLVAAAAVLAVLPAAVSGCGIKPHEPPHVRSVSVSVYGQGSRSVTSDVYATNSWRNW